MVEDSHPEPINSNDTMEVGESIVDAQPGNEHEKRFPINDSLLVGSGAASNFVPSAPPSFLPYPIIDLSEVAPPLPSQAPPAPVVLPLLANPPQLVSEKNEVEEKLLGELEAMGFTLVDLNKEILRKNDYDLQKTVDDLCGVSEWNTILEELREMVSLVFYFFSFHPFSSYIYIYIYLFIYFFSQFDVDSYHIGFYGLLMQGFHDTELNKKLLKKNDGSITLVVMDLIDGEEQ